MKSKLTKIINWVTGTTYIVKKRKVGKHTRGTIIGKWEKGKLKTINNYEK